MNGERGNILSRVGQNFIHLLLILILGGLAPLSYLDGYSPHIGLQTYHFSLLQPPTLLRIRSIPGDAPMAVKAHLAVTWASSLTQATDHYVPYLPGIARYVRDNFGYGYPLPEFETLTLNLTASSLLDGPVFLGRSAWLAPPDKPPA